jgi:hypothetical protein
MKTNKNLLSTIVYLRTYRVALVPAVIVAIKPTVTNQNLNPTMKIEKATINVTGAIEDGESPLTIHGKKEEANSLK